MSLSEFTKSSTTRLLTAFLLSLMLIMPVYAGDLEDIKRSGVLRHLGVPYAHFVTGSGDGLDVELITLFADYLGVEYRYVEASWKEVLSDLSGKTFKVKGGKIKMTGDAPVRGDLIANGLTVLPWRRSLIDYSEPTFPSGVWLLTKAEYNMLPIEESGSEQQDIDMVKAGLNGRVLLGIENSCLDPKLYNLSATGAKIKIYKPFSNPIELIPALLRGESETTLLDVPDALIALEKWPGQIKVIGPISERQTMAVGFAKDSIALRDAFNTFFMRLKQDGRYQALVRKYYPTMSLYFSEFFKS